jgi:hypothetical protein
MSKAFPTKHELSVSYGRWTLVLSITGFVLWLVCYITGIMLIYGFVCPPMLAGAVWCAFEMLRNERSVQGWLLLAFSIICLAISLLPWFLPIATLR